MHDRPRRIRIRTRLPEIAATIIALACLATAGFAGVALAKTFTLQVAKTAKVIDTTGVSRRATIAVNAHGGAVYLLTGDGKHHPECTRTNGCFTFWRPVTVGSQRTLSKAAGISGRLDVWRRDGFLQVLLAGHPLYTFTVDRKRNVATGEGIRSFGGVWHVIKASAPGRRTTTTSTSTSLSTSTSSKSTTTTSMSTTMTTSCLYPPCY